MKIDDLTNDSVPGYGAKRNANHPEVGELLNARLANMLFDCPTLARDEIELANFIINKLDVNPHYVPSETLLQAIRAINDKLGGTSSAHGMIRTA
ncbi:hypothetical protein H5368_06120 [Luteimonas sp. MC1782]|uniref:hypothetical protein n=1 Tax=Luteimonas sp. MC1782 TaxID=2760305 RepID=UPI0015FFBBAC|nr:hypothetical protein [Luteimonas sp. MC1782]MBB1472599.1 hypothetical protein [Luteimonas sp. MC1782]